MQEQILRPFDPPVFPKRDFFVTDYGAVGDGRTDSTEAFNRAIEIASRAGGGRVVVPKGDFRTRAVRLRSNVEFHVAERATIRFSRDPSDYLPVVHTSWEGVELYNYSPLLYAYGEENLAITGGGVLDGQADDHHWWPWKRGDDGQPCQEMDRAMLFNMAEQKVPVRHRIFGKGHYLRPSMIETYRCRNVLIDGVILLHSPMWHVHPVLCSNVIVQNVRIHGLGPNNDGVNPESCRNVVIKNCIFNTGDDCIAIKSFRNADGRRIDVPAENILIQNNLMKNGHGGVSIGSEVTGGARNILIQNNLFDSPSLERALRVKTNSVRGGRVENIYFLNNEVRNVKEQAIQIDMFYEEGDAGENMPIIRQVEICDLKSCGGRIGVEVKAYARSPVTGFRIVDALFAGVEHPVVLEHVEIVEMNRVTFNR